MDENQVVEAVCRYLERQGYTISKRLTTKQRGIDIEAYRNNPNISVFVEAKGGTSSRPGSARFGMPYSPSQVFDRVAKGVYTTLELREKYPNRKSEKVILAIPKTDHFERYLKRVQGALRKSDVEVLLVGRAGDVVLGNWESE